jgi:ATP-dependent RNA helicase UAP56/SUB2
VLGEDLICQAKSGMGKTAVFVIAVLHQLDLKKGDPMQCLVLAHTRELAYQIHKEFERLGRYVLNLRCELFFGGVNIQTHRDILKNKPPHIAIGTPGRVLDLVKSGHMNLDKLRFFILDECDKMLDQVGTHPLTRHAPRHSRHLLQNQTQ